MRDALVAARTMSGAAFRRASLRGLSASSRKRNSSLAFGHDKVGRPIFRIEYFLAEDSLFAWSHDGQPIAPEHGGPVRLIVPQLYAWKSAKWVKGVRFLEHDQAGFWEEGGYHMRGVPWNGATANAFAGSKN